MSQQAIQIRFDQEDASLNNQLAKSLQSHLNEELDTVSTTLMRDAGNTMDLGSVLEVLPLILGSSAVTALATGIAVWIKQNNRSNVILEVDGKKLELKYVQPKDALKAIELFLQGSTQ